MGRGKGEGGKGNRIGEGIPWRGRDELQEGGGRAVALRERKHGNVAGVRVRGARWAGLYPKCNNLSGFGHRPADSLRMDAVGVKLQ